MHTRKTLGVWLVALCFSASSVIAQAASPEFANIVAAASPSVVNISATSKPKPTAASAGVSSDDDVQDLLRRFYGLDAPAQTPRSKQAYGSGFIISADGYVLTNNHVIDEADKIMVRLSDRREMEAKLIGTDPRTDIALLKIAATGLPVVKIGDPNLLRVGDWVLAIGSPFGFDYSATAGIVSAKARALPNEAYVPFIQTDVAINPGNSGGPLFNETGEVVGINSQIYSRSGGFMGVSFAIPVDVAMDVVGQLRDKGKVNRGYLGVAIQEVTKDLADAYGLERPAGALIASVEPGSPADKGGLKQGDVVTHFAGKMINLSAELPQAIGRAKVGETYPVSVFRDHKAQQLQVKIDSIPIEQPVVADKPAAADLSRLGVTVRDLRDNEKEQLKIKAGALVISVTEGSAADAGLRAGDVITRMGAAPIISARDFVTSARKLSLDKAVALTIVRHGGGQILALKPDQQDANK